MDKVALVTGLAGQDDAYPAERLLSKRYAVHGVKHRSSSSNTARIEHLYCDRHDTGVRFRMHYGDQTDSTKRLRLVPLAQPDEIDNLTVRSHVQVSFETPEYTANADAPGTPRLREGIRNLRSEKAPRFHQASTSELFGKVQETSQREIPPFAPRSLYAVAKLHASRIAVNHREACGLFAANRILFGHEGPTRGETFVTRKIIRAVAAIEAGRENCLCLGNPDAKRAWGYVRDRARLARALAADTPSSAGAGG